AAAEDQAKAKVENELIAAEAAAAEAERLHSQRLHRFKGRVLESDFDNRSGRVELLGFPYRRLPNAVESIGAFVRLCTSDQRRTAAYLPQLAHVVAAAAFASAAPSLSKPVSKNSKKASNDPDDNNDKDEQGISSLLLGLLRRQMGSRLPDLGLDDEDLRDEDDDQGGRRDREGAWLELQPVPSDDELLKESGYLRGLEPVVVKGPYRNADHYYDTYFRLYRADCFEKIVSGIADYRAGKLDPRDMPLYGRVRVWAVRLSMHGCPLSVAVQFTELNNLGGGNRSSMMTNWRKSSRLMQGNLVCLSTNGRFDPEGGRCPLIWATALVGATPAGTTLMAESPSLFRAFEPVLRSLQACGAGLSATTISRRRQLPPFRSVLVDADMSEASERPQYIQEYYGLGEPPLPTISTGSITLDPCQKEALTNALHHKVALIQGPPGTGKSFLGVLLIRQILALPTLPHGPVLVMSYKNHALDEFLMDLMALPGMEDKVVRVGGRCSNAELEKVSLNILRKDKVKHPKSKALNHEFYSVYEDAGQRQAQLKARLNHVSRLLSEPGVLVQEAATRAQLRTLLVNWRPSVLHQQKLRQEAIAEWKNLRKPIEDPEALAAWLDIPLVRQAVHTAVACWLPNKEERRQHAATAAASSNSAGAESVESHIARVLANFEQRFGQVLSGKAKSNKQQQQKQQQQQPTDDPVDDEDTEAAEFAMQQRQSAFMFQLGKKRTTDVVVKF
uniref:AAA_11 domain-containing protein n=1 Tax=Macrostomum lignano TaxID=282301 RepID=A0A1I8G7N3_9PLAT